jgi:hypothetical protein
MWIQGPSEVKNVVGEEHGGRNGIDMPSDEHRTPAPSILAARGPTLHFDYYNNLWFLPIIHGENFGSRLEENA